jgi:hypothetical protein
LLPAVMNRLLLFAIFFFSGYLFSSAQMAQPAHEGQSNLVQFSGVVVTADSLKPIPFVNVIIRNTWRGTVTDYFGFFSFVARMNDTIEFSSLGYKKINVCYSGYFKKQSLLAYTNDAR